MNKKKMKVDDEELSEEKNIENPEKSMIEEENNEN